MEGIISQQSISKTNSEGGSNTPLLITQPYNLITFLSYFSPIILVTIVVSSSFFYQNMKGFFYLLFLIFFAGFRGFMLKMFGSDKNKDNRCGFVQYGSYGNATFTTFVFAFTMMYLFLPMYQNNGTNWVIVLVLIFYICLDIGIKLLQGCLQIQNNMQDIIGDFLSGSLLGAVAVAGMYLSGAGQNLFFVDNTQNGTTCSMPKKQTFKCNVFRNGELISSSTT